jgi:hypothetical protein
MPQKPPNPPVRHHYVPRSYLAAFTPTGDKTTGALWVYTRDRAKEPFRTGLRVLAAENDLHPSAEFERALATDVEAPFAAWQHRVVLGAVLGLARHPDALRAEERTAIARYLAVQQMRTPAYRLLSERLGELAVADFFRTRGTRQTIQTLYDLLVAERALDRRAEDLRAFARHVQQVMAGKMSADPHRWLEPIRRFAERLVPIIRDELTWRLAELPPDVEECLPFCTSDNPLVLARPRERGRSGGRRLRGARTRDPGWNVSLGAGWREPGFEAALPLSTRHALLLARDPDTLQWAEEPTRLAQTLRVRTVRNALQRVYARDHDARVGALLVETPPPRVQLVVDGVTYAPDEDAQPIAAHATRASRVSRVVDIRYDA